MSSYITAFIKIVHHQVSGRLQVLVGGMGEIEVLLSEQLSIWVSFRFLNTYIKPSLTEVLSCRCHIKGANFGTNMMIIVIVSEIRKHNC